MKPLREPNMFDDNAVRMVVGCWCGASNGLGGWRDLLAESTTGSQTSVDSNGEDD